MSTGVGEEKRGLKRTAIKRHPIVTFFVLAYTFSWLPWVLGTLIPASRPFVLYPFFSSGPLLAALIVIPITQGRFWDDKPRWSPDGRVIYFISVRGGFVNVWARRFDSVRGEAVGESFEVTTFQTPARMLLPRIMQLHMALANHRIILPMTDVSASIWVLDNVGEL